MLCVLIVEGMSVVVNVMYNVMYNKCDAPTSCLMQPIGARCCEVMYFGCFGFRGELGFLNYDFIIWGIVLTTQGREAVLQHTGW